MTVPNNYCTQHSNGKSDCGKSLTLMTLVTTALSSVAAIPATAQAVSRPNIIYIFTDQHTAGALSCAGNPDVQTPNLDRLATAGILFTNAYCTAPLSGPSRAAMFTGRYPGSVGMGENGAPMPDSLKQETLGVLLSQAGYECVYGGKWHLPTTEIPDKEFGFSHIYEHSDTGLAAACATYLARPHKTPFFLVASFDNPHNICEYARSQNLPYGNLPDFDLSDCPGLPANFAVNPYDAHVVAAEKAANFNIYPTAHFTPDDWRRYRYAYYRLVEKIDTEIGVILDAIDQNRLWDNTVVIFSSDHGDGVGAHQWNQKSALYEEIVNVPLLVTLPCKSVAGKMSTQLINNGVDFYATVCDWAGVSLPKGAAGKSFRKSAENVADAMQAPYQEFIVTETQFDGSKTRGWMVRDMRFKYVLYDKGPYREQLFDMQCDKGEMRNLVVESAYQEELLLMRGRLYAWMRYQHIRPTRGKVNDVPGY